MKSVTLGTVALLTMVAPARGQQVPFAEPTPSSGQIDPAALPGLGDLMILTQLRHIKLWYAGKAGNWELVNYELDRIVESLGKAAVLYRNIPVEYILAADGPLTDMRGAVKAKDSGRFNGAYSALTSACNACHAGAGIGFVRLQTPTNSPLNDQIYSAD
jgi:hypothetical protein